MLGTALLVASIAFVLARAGGDSDIGSALAWLRPVSARSAALGVEPPAPPPDRAPDQTAPGEVLGEPDGLSKTNLEGDEVSPALATYGIDQEGNLFELHSPRTEIPRLARPTS